ncbi:CoA-binding protein [Tunicatimonas pelagia]|uniref:CoA-binding protein n=1 Tax=Tunicatimonas pelagia TaxID=931531 RepID=UPI002665C32E|nr:CoA-binding protein [Tunicatimonas pelagia]WKN44766.1 CoA-binding protein [Tunicatimonas pelagia]
MSEKKKTAIIGASPNPARYAYLAAHMLTEYGHPIVPLSIKQGSVADVEFIDLRTKPSLKSIDTVTLYLGPAHQPEWYDYLLSLQPQRIIFNPGTENPELYQLCQNHNIEPINACTLVMLRAGTY